jgi:polygalacturonase
VTIQGCIYRVDDDCVCLKGSKGPFAMQDKDSPPVEHIRVRDCTFERGGGVVTMGSEATVVRDVVVENCTVRGRISMAKLKLRPDTPQDYEDIHYRNITLDGRGTMLDVQPWLQFFDLKGQPKPKSLVSNVTLTNIKGSYGSLGIVEGNAGQTLIRNITLKNINLIVTNDDLYAVGVKNFTIRNVIVNGKAFTVAN